MFNKQPFFFSVQLRETNFLFSLLSQARIRMSNPKQFLLQAVFPLHSVVQKHLRR